ncbi:hypothetical protein [Sporosarcina gallistercoris]|uniref:hypothetical protein n=1 Tax=Sporosarcina gallistercoris TaxID=2762245 RepID=UPI001781D713|nr:hypothetical protein [Sporosarcina gallistercoris]
MVYLRLMMMTSSVTTSSMTGAGIMMDNFGSLLMTVSFQLASYWFLEMKRVPYCRMISSVKQ